jgi:hypothetical protein
MSAGRSVEVAMRTWWLWASVVALCVSPTLAEARERARERGDGGGGRSSAERRSERGSRDRGASSRDNSDHATRRQERPRELPSWAPRHRSDSGAGAGWHSSPNARSDRREGSRFSSGWARGDNRRDDIRRDDNRRDDNHSRQTFRGAPRYDWPSRSFRHAPRYPSYYRYGYYHRHGYYFPRYYFDYDSYPTYASVRVLVEPDEAEVYVDGYYAGIVDDFDGILQRLNLTPGSHEITLRLDGYQTWSAEVYGEPGSTVSLHHDMVPGAGGPEVEEYSNEGEYDGPEAPQP